MEVAEIPTLKPGGPYVIQMSRRFRTKEDFDQFRAYLAEAAPKCTFLILEDGFELVCTPDQRIQVGEHDTQLPY
jgi:hypothetical protein